MDDIILKGEQLTKLYGINKKEALRLMNNGSNKDAVYKKTGVTVALWDVSFEVKRGEIFTIIGLSGSGKSTLVRCINMLQAPTNGQIFFEGRDIVTLPRKELIKVRKNKISMVFQNFGLMSHRNVIDNITYGLEIKGVSKAERDAKGIEMMDMVGLKGLERQSIESLSGGMRQRVGIARALANDPDVLLMDEPFSALDPLVRNDMQFELLSIQRTLGKTIVFITHDINEAFKISDTVAIMKDGIIVQIDTPQQMSSNPADEYVKRFINSADKTKVLSAKNVMTKPSCVVRLRDSAEYAIQLMRKNEVSSTYVIDEKMVFYGMLTLDAALSAHKAKVPFTDSLIKDVPQMAQDTLICDIIAVAVDAKFPLAVIDEKGCLKGIISRATVLSSII